MRSRSKKTAALYRNVRVPLVKRLLDERPVCEMCDRARSVDVHEIKPRGRGGSITDEANLKTVCRACHDWIGLNDDEAIEAGFSAHSWDGNTT